MRTTSRCPWRTRRRISVSTASAVRLRVPPRTSGITQNAHENEQPSWILTNARTRSRRCGGLDAADRADIARDEGTAASSPFAGDDDVRRAAPANAALEVRGAARHVHGACARAAARDAACRDFETASWVTQHVLTTAISPPLVDLDVTVREQPLADRLGVGERHLAARGIASRTSPSGRARRSSAIGLAGVAWRSGRRPTRRARSRSTCRQPGVCGPLAGEVAGRDRALAPRAARGSPRPARAATFATATSAGGRARRERVDDPQPPPSTPLPRRSRRSPRPRPDRRRRAMTGAKPSRAAGDREHARAAADVEQRPAARELGEQLDAEPRRRVGTGAERAARVDDDGARRIGRRLPRRADPDPGHPTGRWNARQASSQPSSTARRSRAGERARASVLGVSPSA